MRSEDAISKKLQLILEKLYKQETLVLWFKEKMKKLESSNIEAVKKRNKIKGSSLC